MPVMSIFFFVFAGIFSLRRVHEREASFLVRCRLRNGSKKCVLGAKYGPSNKQYPDSNRSGCRDFRKKCGGCRTEPRFHRLHSVACRMERF